MKSNLIIGIFFLAIMGVVYPSGADQRQDRDAKQDRPARGSGQSVRAREREQQSPGRQQGSEQQFNRVQNQPQKGPENAPIRRFEPQQWSNSGPRSPSMSRPNFRNNEIQSTPNIPKQNNETIKQQARQFQQERKSRQLNLPSDVKRSPRTKDEFQEFKKNNREAADKVSSRVKKNYPAYHKWFNKQSFKEHHFHSHYWHDHVNWWKGAHWYRVHRWLGWGGSIYPIYYDSVGIPVQINIDIVNYDQQNSVNDPSYQDDSQIASNEGEWLPLGVFALGSDPVQASYSNNFIQLAINQQGDLAGTYYNSSTDQYYPIEGVVDQETQQAYWKISEGAFVPAMTTGLYNLTQDVVNIQLTFPEGTIQNWALVRLEDT